MNRPIFRIFWVGIMILCVVSCFSTPRKVLDNFTDDSAKYVNDNKATCGLFTTLNIVKQKGALWKFEKYPYDSEKVYKDIHPACLTCWVPSQAGKSQAKQGCSKNILNGEEAFLLWERPYGDPNGYTHIKEAVTIGENYLYQLGQENQRKQRVQQQQAQQRQTDDRASKCISFGFQPNTSQYKDCMFELYKLEESARQNQALIQSLSDSSARQNAILQQQLEEQQFESGMRMLQNAADMINPPSTRTTCRYNALMKKVTCN
jgi:hypothetical protein